IPVIIPAMPPTTAPLALPRPGIGVPAIAPPAAPPTAPAAPCAIHSLLFRQLTKQSLNFPLLLPSRPDEPLSGSVSDLPSPPPAPLPGPHGVSVPVSPKDMPGPSV